MKHILLGTTLLSFASSFAFADIPVRDANSIARLQEISNTTDDILKEDKEIKENTVKILEAVTGNRDGSLGMGQEGAAGGTSVAKAPSMGSVLNGGAMSFGGLGDAAKQIGSLMVNGMKLVKDLKAMFKGKEVDTAVNSVYQNGVNTVALTSAMIEETTAGVKARNETVAGIAGKIGQAPDLKGAMDENSRLQAETINTTNELIGVQNAAALAINQKVQIELVNISETAKLVKKKEVNPFAELAKE
jgi:hypothetical protein